MASYTPILSEEVVLLILEQVSQISPQTLPTLCRVSRRFCQLATSVLYRSITVPSRKLLYDTKHTKGDETYSFETNMLEYSRHLFIYQPLPYKFVNLLTKMKRLESISWKYWETPFPRVINQVLCKHWPDCKLHIEELFIGHRTDDGEVQDSDRELLMSLVGCPNIHSIKVEIDYEHPVSMRWLKDVLLSSPKLETLHMTVPRTSQGISFRCDGLGVYNLCVQPGETLGSLKELVYEARAPYGRLDLQSFSIPASFFNWSKLRHLELRGLPMFHLIRSMDDQILNLQTLKLEFCSLPSHQMPNEEKLTILEKFLSNVRGLETLVLHNDTPHVPISALAIHQDTLKHLSIRYPNFRGGSYWSTYAAGPWTAQELDRLNRSCPHISHLALDIPISDHIVFPIDPPDSSSHRNHLKPYRYLTALSQFPQLRTATLYPTFLDALGIQPPNIATDTNLIRTLFLHLRARKVGVPFEQLELILKSSQQNHGSPHFPPRSSRPTLLFTCRVNAEGDVVVEYDNSVEKGGWEEYFEWDRDGVGEPSVW